MRCASGCQPPSLTPSGRRALCCAPRHVTLAFPELAPRVDTRSALLDEHLAAEAAWELGPGQLPSPGGHRGPRGPVSAQRGGVQERAAHACPGVLWGHGTEHGGDPWSQPREAAGQAAGEVRAEAGALEALGAGRSVRRESGRRPGLELRRRRGRWGGDQLPSTRSPHRQGVPPELSRRQPVDGHVCRPACPATGSARPSSRGCGRTIGLFTESCSSLTHSDLSALLAQSGLGRELKL